VAVKHVAPPDRGEKPVVSSVKHVGESADFIPRGGGVQARYGKVQRASRAHRLADEADAKDL